MGSRVLEIVVFLMSHIKDHQGRLESIDDISSVLKSNGFTDNEISSAYSWVLDQIQAGSQLVLDDGHSNNSFRILSEQERMDFTSEATGYLLQLRHLGLVSDSQIELILEKSVFLGCPPIDLEQIKILIGAMLFRESDVPDASRQQVFLLPDDDGMVN